MKGATDDAVGTREAAPAGGDVRLIAFYAPQLDPVPRNDRGLGEGPAEWTRVRNAAPNFAGHYQPHEPGELGEYDWRDAAARERQASLAREYGIYGFCYYYDWFNGKKPLERPLDEVVASGKPDFPFCVCWANENPTRRDDVEQPIPIAQSYSVEDARALIHVLIPVMRDRRYIRVGGKPLVLIYKVALIPDPAAMLAVWRDECRRAGVGEIYVVAALTTWDENPEELGFDAAAEFPPQGHHAERVNDTIAFTNPRFSGSVFNFRTYVAQLVTVPRPDFKLFRTLLPSWDATARQQDAGTVFVGSSPELFQYWLEHALEQTRLRHRGDERLIFINAWNQWGEGCHLEPDKRYGRAWLEAIRDARAVPRPIAPKRPAWADLVARAKADDTAPTTRIIRSAAAADVSRAAPRVSVVMPAYNHERFVQAALDSVVAQSLAELEIIAVDDGSQDATGALLDGFAETCTTHAVTIVHQPNAGAHAAINRGLARARGEFVAIINSDDRYAPARLATMLDALRDRRADFAFSNTRFIDDAGEVLADEDACAGELREGIAQCLASADPLPALLRANVAISTGNFVFRRSLLEKTGGMCAFRVCHDWDFILAASYFTPIAFVRERLYDYRLHRANTFSGQLLIAHLESDQVIDRFFERIEAHPVMREPGSRDRFLDEVRRRGLTSFLPGVRAL